MTSREDYKAELDHIAEVSRNARATWFGLIGTLLFSGVTLLSVRDRHFFEYGAATKLPILNFDVPIVGFFWTAPILVLALYVYLHIYLIKLWRALALLFAKAPSSHIDDEVYPWLLSDAAIRLKTGHRRDFGWLTALVSWALGWAFGPVILFFFWIRSWPRHDEILTLFLGALFFASILLALESRHRRRDWMLRDGQSAKSGMRWAGSILCVVFAPLVALVSWETTEGRFVGWLAKDTPFEQPLLRFAETIDTTFYRNAPKPYINLGADPFRDDPELDLRIAFLAPAQLYRAEISKGEWTPSEQAWNRFRRENREKIAQDLARGDIEPAKVPAHLRQNSTISDGTPQANEGDLAPTDHEIRYTMLREFNAMRTEQAKSLEKPDLQKADLRRAYLREAVLSGLDLREAKLERADLSDADLHSAVLKDADLRSAILSLADLQSADLRDADLRSAVLRDADLRSADLREADLRNAVLLGADLRSAVLPGADLQSAVLLGADLQSAVLLGADLRSAVLLGADLQSANLREADLQSADLRGVNITGGKLDIASIISADMRGLRGLTQEMLEASYGDASTQFEDSCVGPNDGTCIRPDHWATVTLSAEQRTPCWQKWGKDLAPWAQWTLQTDRSAECTEYP